MTTTTSPVAAPSSWRECGIRTDPGYRLAVECTPRLAAVLGHADGRLVDVELLAADGLEPLELVSQLWRSTYGVPSSSKECVRCAAC